MNSLTDNLQKIRSLGVEMINSPMNQRLEIQRQLSREVGEVADQIILNERKSHGPEAIPRLYIASTAGGQYLVRGISALSVEMYLVSNAEVVEHVQVASQDQIDYMERMGGKTLYIR